MKLPHLLKSTILAFALSIGSIAYADDESEGKHENEQDIDFKDVPPAAQKTIQDSLAGGVVSNVEKESQNSNIQYSADVKKGDGDKVEIKVAEDGKLIEQGPDDVKEEEEEDED